jgi:hypothetical protein
MTMPTRLDTMPKKAMSATEYGVPVIALAA